MLAQAVSPVRLRHAEPQCRRASRSNVVAIFACVLLAACHSERPRDSASIRFTRVPQADAGGKEKNDIIEGVVAGARPGQQIVLYAKSGNNWWVQPLVAHPFTAIHKDAKWTNATHLGTQYAALLVESGYRPAPVISALPPISADVAAVAVVPGGAKPPSPVITFSGYEWRVRTSPSGRGGTNRYDPSNAWTDPAGAMHLRIAKSGADWTCAEVSLTRSEGYGTYEFVVRDTAHLEPAAILDMFTWDYAGGEQNNREMNIQIGRWGTPAVRSGRYVVQPYYVPNNVFEFMAPAGRLTHSLRWEEGRLSFRTVRGSPPGSQAQLVAEHVFTSGVPSPGIESVRIALYDYRNSPIPLQQGAEVVIERFAWYP